MAATAQRTLTVGYRAERWAQMWEQQAERAEGKAAAVLADPAAVSEAFAAYIDQRDRCLRLAAEARRLGRS